MQLEVKAPFKHCEECNYLELDKTTVLGYDTVFATLYKCENYDICKNAVDIYLRERRDEDDNN